MVVDIDNAFEIEGGGIIIEDEIGIFADSNEPDYDAPEYSMHLGPGGIKFRLNNQWTGIARPRLVQSAAYEDVYENELVFDTDTEQLLYRSGIDLYKFCVCAIGGQAGQLDFSNTDNNAAIVPLFFGVS